MDAPDSGHHFDQGGDPESVEVLRAQRDAALAEVSYLRTLVDIVRRLFDFPAGPTMS